MAPIKPIPIPLPLSLEFIVKFWSKIKVGSATDCWPWIAGHTVDGYGTIHIGEKAFLAHRIAYAIVNGADPELCLHSCDNEPCCNPNHLQSGTQADNMRQAAQRGRFPKKLKLTPEQVRAIRTDTRSHSQIARKYGVSPSHVTGIKLRTKRQYID